MSSLVQQAYYSQIDSLTPSERMARCVAMLHWTRELLGRQLLAELGPLPAQRLKWEVAKRMYGSDPVALALIERKLADVSG
ncbi:MAG: hypothetical protein U1A77_22730 [Pirellulales bacterium]|jgi:hypothetical protein